MTLSCRLRFVVAGLVLFLAVPADAGRIDNAAKQRGLARSFVSGRAAQLLRGLAASSAAEATQIARRIEAVGPDQQAGLPRRALPDLQKYQRRLTERATRSAARVERLAAAAASLEQSPGAKQALGRILQRRSLPQILLAQLLSNPLVIPELPRLLPALAKADRIPGAREAVVRMAQAADAAGLKGARFEIEVGPKLPGITTLCGKVGGLETDAILAPGARGRETIVAMHTLNVAPGAMSRAELRRHFHKTVRGEVEELKRRLEANPSADRPLDGAVVLGRPDGMRLPRMDWQHAADRLGAHLSVYVVNTDSNRMRRVFAGEPSVSAP